MAKKFDNKFVPKYIPSDLPWHKRDGLDTWYLQCKCNEFLEDTDGHFKNMNIINFDMINNKLSAEQIKQYQFIDYHEINKYPYSLRQEICSSIFRNVERTGMYVHKDTINKHFKGNGKGNGKLSGIGRRQFTKTIKDSHYAETW